MSNHLNGLSQFIDRRKDQIINNAFVIYACRVDSMEMSVPLAIVPSNHRCANDGILRIFAIGQQVLAALHIDFQRFLIDKY
jgi:hypothetical protein